MQAVNSIYCFQVRAPGDVSKYVKSIKKDAATKLENHLMRRPVELEDFGNFEITNCLTKGEVDVLQTKISDNDDVFDVVFTMDGFDTGS